MSGSIETTLNLEIPFFDVDSYRVVWHGNYPKYFEIARCQLLEHIGYPYSKMELSGYFFPVIDIRTRYIKPIMFRQNVCVTATLKEWKHRLIIDYSITDTKSKERLTKAQTTQVAVLMPEYITQFQSPPELISSIETLLT
jgi:acyl-CoA thioester hydrolase